MEFIDHGERFDALCALGHAAVEERKAYQVYCGAARAVRAPARLAWIKASRSLGDAIDAYVKTTDEITHDILAKPPQAAPKR